MRVDLAGQINWFNKLAINKYGGSIQLEENTKRGIMVVFSASSGFSDHVAVATWWWLSICFWTLGSSSRKGLIETNLKVLPFHTTFFNLIDRTTIRA